MRGTGWPFKRSEEEAENFKNIGTIISNEGSKPEILSRIAQTQLFLDWRSRISRLLLLSWCGRSSYPPSFMPVRAGPWQQREGSKPLRWDAIWDFWTFPTKTMWRTRRFVTESRMQVHDNLLTMVKKRKQTVWPHLKILWHGEDNSVGDSERSKKERKTEEKMEDNIKEWTGMGFEDSLRAAEDREGRKGIVATASVVLRLLKSRLFIDCKIMTISA